MLDTAPQPDLQKWEKVLDVMNHFEREVDIAIVGKYCGLPDAYKSLREALVHGGFKHKAKVNMTWINSEELECMSDEQVAAKLWPFDAVLVPGGFGSRGIEGKIKAIHYARTQQVPFFGICLGMQTAVIEIARHVLGIADANSSEFDKQGTHIINRMTVWEQDGKKMIRPEDGDLGGTMRLGAYPCVLKDGSLAQKVYGGAKEIAERHRHRYEMDISYEKALQEKGVIISGKSPDGLLPEIVEIPEHPFFIAGQFHPEFKSKPFAPHPLFEGFIEAALGYRSRRG